MKEMIKEIKEFYAPMYADIKAPAKKIAWFAWFLFCVCLFFFIGHYVATLLIQDWAGTPIEKIPAHCGWIMLRAVLTGLTALGIRKIYLLRKKKKTADSPLNPGLFNKTFAWFSALAIFYLAGYHLTYVIVQQAAGTGLENIPPYSGWMLFRTALIGLATLLARKGYFLIRNSED